MQNEQKMNISLAGQKLLAWAQENGRQGLPWRQTDLTPYHIWISEIMLQQTQVNRVIPFYTRFIERFPTVQALAQTSWEDFVPYYQGLGYYNRGRNMLKTAQLVVEQHDGQFPSTFDELRALPGIGEYTANAILSFGYGQPTLAFDTNQQRVWGRLLTGSKTRKVPPSEIAEALTPTLLTAELNAALMDFANLVCTKTPHCDECPLKTNCQYFATRGELEPIVTKAKNTFPAKQAQTFLFLHENHRRYFSSQPDYFEPFQLPVPVNTRHTIQEYFARHYHLELAVRPPFAKGYVNEQPTLFTRAQILLGQPPFATFTKQDANTYLERDSIVMLQ